MIGKSVSHTTAGVAAALCLGGVLAIAGGSAAYAKDEYKLWNSDSNPLRVSGSGSTVSAWGQWRVTDSSNGTRSFLDARVWYNNADDHKKYVNFETHTSSGICIAPQYTSCSAQFFFYAGDETPHSNEEEAEWLYANTSLPGDANSAKALAWACIDIPLRPDPCSDSAITVGTNY